MSPIPGQSYIHDIFGFTNQLNTIEMTLKHLTCVSSTCNFNCFTVRHLSLLLFFSDSCLFLSDSRSLIRHSFVPEFSNHCRKLSSNIIFSRCCYKIVLCWYVDSLVRRLRSYVKKLIFKEFVRFELSLRRHLRL